MERRYQTMFDQALERLGPSEEKLAAQRRELARRWESKAERRTGGRRRYFAPRALLAGAAAVCLLCVTAVAVAANWSKKTLILSVTPYEYGLAYHSNSQETGVFEQRGRYYLQVEPQSEPIDITGQLSDTVPYVYTRYFPESAENQRVPPHVDYVIGGSGENIRHVIVDYLPEKDGEGSQIGGMVSYGVKGCPVWWRKYLNDRGALGRYSDGYETLRETFANYVSQQGFRWVNGGAAVDEEGRVILTVKGEALDITGELENGQVYLLDAKGEENVIVSYDKSRTKSDRWEWSYSDYEDTLVWGTYDHAVLVCRDGGEVRWAEFIYRPDGSLRYWQPWNCPTAKELDWLEPYASAHGFELDWLVQHAYEIRDKNFG